MKKEVFCVVSLITLVVFSSGALCGGAEFGWKPVGTGDCAGMDVGGLTYGSPMPEASKCNAHFKGKTAVCWDGMRFKHYGSETPQCTYKNIEPQRCAGGASPGYMYECKEITPYVWVPAGEGDCSGRDVHPLSIGSSEPVSELCNAGFVNKTAVCWDGSSKKHWGSDKPQCTYKDIMAEQCVGGGSPGYRYKCVYRPEGKADAQSGVSPFVDMQ